MVLGQYVIVELNAGITFLLIKQSPSVSSFRQKIKALLFETKY